MIPPVIENPLKLPNIFRDELRKETERLKQENPELSLEEICDLALENLWE